MHARAGGFDSRDRFDEVDRVVVVLLDAGGDGENIGVEDNVLRSGSRLFR